MRCLNCQIPLYESSEGDREYWLGQWSLCEVCKEDKEIVKKTKATLLLKALIAFPGGAT